MTDNELILQISKMFDPVRNSIEEMRQDISELRKDTAEMRQDIVELKISVKRVELIQENQILPRLNTIEACYTSTFDRYKDNVEDYEAMKQDISIIKKVVTEHSEKLQKLA